MAQTIWDDPTDEQSVLLRAILAIRGDDGSWPTVPQLADHLRHELDVRTVLDSFPAAETSTGTRYRAVWHSADDEVGLTLAAGLLTVDYEIAPYLAIVRTCAARVAKAGPVTITSSRFHRQFGADHTFHVRTFPAVLRREPLGAAAEIREDGDDWSITFGGEFAAYKSVRHLRDYVRTSLDGPAAPEPRKEYVDPALLQALAETEHPRQGPAARRPSRAEQQLRSPQPVRDAPPPPRRHRREHRGRRHGRRAATWLAGRAAPLDRRAELITGAGCCAGCCVPSRSSCRRRR